MIPLLLAGAGALLLLGLAGAGGAPVPPPQSRSFAARTREIAGWPEVQEVSARYGWPPEWLASAINKESGGDTSVSNRYGFTGLLQLHPRYIEEEGYTIFSFGRLSRRAQLQIFEKRYFRPYASKIHSACDLRLALFLPAALSLPQDAVLYASDGSTAIPGWTPARSRDVWAKNEGVKRSPRMVIRRRDIC